MKRMEKALSGHERVRMTFLTEKVVRVQWDAGGVFEDTGLNRYGFIGEPVSEGPCVEVTECKDGFTAETPEVRVEFMYGSRALMVTDTGSDKVVLHQVGAEFNQRAATARFKAAPGEDWVGLWSSDPGTAVSSGAPGGSLGSKREVVYSCAVFYVHSWCRGAGEHDALHRV